MTLPMSIADPRPQHVAGVFFGVIVATALSAWIAFPIFVGLGAICLLLTAYAAFRWPVVTVVVAALAVLADPVLVPTVLPDSMTLGPIGVSEPLLAVASLVIAVRAVQSGRFWPALRDPVVPLVVLFVLASAISAALNATPLAVAALGTFMTIDAIAVYVVARMLPCDRRGVATAVGAVVGVAVAASIMGIAQVVLHPDLLGFASFAGRFGEGGRITSFLGNPNMVAVVVGFAIPFPLFAARRLVSRRDRRLAFAVVTLFCLTLLLTFSRGAWLAVALGLLIGILVVDPRSIVVIVAGVLLAWAISIVMPRNLLIAEADLPLYFPESGAPSILDSTLDRLDEVYEKRDLRMRFIREGIPIAVDNPVFGVGPGRYGGAAATIVPSPVYEEYGTGLYGFRTVHNFWLHLVGEVGAIGAAVFLTLILGLIIRFAAAARREPDPILMVLIGGGATALLVVGFNNLTEMIFEGNFPGFVIWLVIGLISTLAPSGPLILGKRGRSHDAGAAAAPVARSGG